MVGESGQSESIEIRSATIPEPPSAMEYTINSQFEVELDWTNSFKSDYYTGGSPIIDYRVSYAMETTSSFGRRLNRMSNMTHYTVLKDGILGMQYTVRGLIPGERYTFVIEARNLVGYSDRSDPLTAVIARAPDAPVQLRVEYRHTTHTTIGLTWMKPSFDGGSELIDYNIW